MSTAAASRFAWTPSREQAARSRLQHFIDALGVGDLDTLHAFARDEPAHFWEAMVDDIGVHWTRRFDTVIDTSGGLPWTRFWVGGRLNLTQHAVYRWAERVPDRTAVEWEADSGATRTLTYQELAAETARAAGALRALGVAEGDAVG
ncbi:MAG: acetyl-coenzyme A synthetase N-terminal domain-containing protein, partial [Candidatus Dormibacteria bacterium]